MYALLVGLTIFVILVLITGTFTPFDTTDRRPTRKEILIKILISLSFLVSAATLLVVFIITTTTILSDTPDVKQSKQPWRVIYKNDINADIKIEPADPGAYGSYGGDRSRGKGISTEILIDIIQQLTDEPDELTFENFINNYFQEFGYSHEVKLKNAKDKYYLGKPINLITEPKPIKRLMPVYTFEELTPELIKTLVSEEFFERWEYEFIRKFEDLKSKKERDKYYGLIRLIRLVAQDKHGRRNHDSFALLLPNFDIEDIYDELDQYKPFVSVENKNLVYSLNKL